MTLLQLLNKKGFELTRSEMGELGTLIAAEARYKTIAFATREQVEHGNTITVNDYPPSFIESESIADAIIGFMLSRKK